MLLNLQIKNYALIDDLRLEFASGFNIFSGETGAGKSIIIESLGLILGDRASAQLIKKDSTRCFITAEFDASGNRELENLIDSSGLSAEEGSLIIRREIDASGKSRAFVNDTPVGLGLLAEIGTLLINVHGQNEHQRIIQSSHQRNLLDVFAGLEETAEKVGGAYRAYSELAAQLESKQLSEQEKARLIDLYSFQVKEIDEARLAPGEEEEIEARLPQLKNADKLKTLADDAYQILYGGDDSVTERLGKAQKAVENITSVCGGLSEEAENLKSAYYQAEEAARQIEKFSDSLRADPDELNKLLERLELIGRLRKKYGKDVSEILRYREDALKELDALQNADENRQELEKRAKKAGQELLKLCEGLSSARKKAAQKLSGLVENEIRELGMKKARVTVSVEKLDNPESHGQDRVEFLFSANPGEEPKPVKNVASGGEMSRLMLALKTVLVKEDPVPVLVFDEIDSGIGGPMGQTVGKKLKNLSLRRQVVCITHLPQIAAFSDRHFMVEKTVKSNKTCVQVKLLSQAEHAEEIARMLSGEKVTISARQHAKELIENTL
ncbi:MAG: DNA repair protein RecN [Endomicrobiales bacterium]|nr:DNA repair protein RecN [Endomicrobiales bacterium]